MRYRDMTKILVVDDEQDLCEILNFNLCNEGFEVTTANSAEEALELIGCHPRGTYALILLDVMMERMSGFEMAQTLRQDGDETPIIFLTARDAHDDQLTGFTNGADDYITKPFSFDTVLARVRAVLRRTTNNGQRTTADNQQATEGYINIGGISIDMEHGKVVLNGKTLALTRREYLILCLLAQKADNYFTREAILEQVWPNDALVNDRSVDVHIARLRKKLDHEGGRLINRTGFGYMIRSFEDTEMDRTKVDTL